MLKTLRVGRKAYYGLQNTTYQRRLFLTEAYRCDDAWNRRLDSPLLKKIKPTELMTNLDQKIATNQKVSAIDVDVFVNAVNSDVLPEELLHIIHNLRLITETSNTLESTHHAAIRFLLEHNHSQHLLNMLHDRLNYGIFPDYFCYNILMDTFIKRKEYGNAAKVAVLPMLQEDVGHPITNALSVYSCHKYLEQPDDWQKPEPPKDDSEEVVKIRVRYIRNPYFDDHFDLVDPRDLVGKTLAFQGKFMNNILGRTCQLRGLILYKKYEDALKLMDKWVNEIKQNIVYAEVFDLIKHDNSYIPEDEISEEFKSVLSRLELLKSLSSNEESLSEAIEKEVKSAIDSQAEKDILKQREVYLDWENIRQLTLDKEIAELHKQSRIQKIQKIKEDLKEREMILTFFEKQEDIELQIEEKEQKQKAELNRVKRIYNSEKKLRKLKEADEYVPPTI